MGINKMIVFTQAGYEYLLPSLPKPNLKNGFFAIHRFANNEMQITLQMAVSKQDCVVIGTIAPPEENLVVISMLCHTLKKEGASKVIALLPYMGYSRQDKYETGKSIAMQWLGETLKASGIDEVWTIDLHSGSDAELFSIKLQSLSPAGLIASQVPELKQRNVTVVAPDAGAIKRAQAVSAAALVARPVCYLHKVRLNDIEHIQLLGDVSEEAVIVDDMLDTGSTLLSCVDKLHEAGVRKITIVVSHGLFTGGKWKQLFALGVSKLYCLDTIPEVAALREPQIEVISAKPIIENALKKLTSQREEKNYAYKK